MPRAERPAADAATPDVEPVPDAPPEQLAAEPDATEPAAAADDGPRWGNWRYVGTEQLTYAAVPATVQPGDVIVHLGPPADDGRWEPTGAEVTKLPDNHRDEPAAAGNQEG